MNNEKIPRITDIPDKEYDDMVFMAQRLRIQLAYLTQKRYNLLLHFLFCLGLIRDYWSYLNLRESIYTSFNPELEKWNREHLIDMIVQRVKNSTINICDIFTEFEKEEEHSIAQSYADIETAWETGLIPTSLNPFDIKPLTAKEENMIDTIRLNFVDYFPDSKGLVGKYILGIDEEGV
jgi:hypothetical protein